MKKSDIFKMALKNLKGRRSRTKLTVTGVVIGTCAIVIMISIGAGINQTLTAQYKNSSSATRISVSKDTAAQESGSEQPPLNESAVEYFSGIEGVETVLPVINMTEYVSVTRGKYNFSGGNVMAVDFEALSKLGVKAQGGELKTSSDIYTVYFGDAAAVSFTDNQGNAVKSEYDEDDNLVYCEIDPLKDSFYISPASSDDGTTAASGAAEHKIRVAGLTVDSGSTGMDTSNSIFIDMRLAQKLIREYNAVNGKPNTKPEYTEILVFANDIENVKAVQDTIGATGLSTYSNEDEQDYIKRIMTAVQLVLGAIGAVSMFVAAFGISNTMVMAVYERTKEIGVMKVIGCDTADIKAVFLCEAGMIGFLGGTIGVFISLVVSLLANLVAGTVMSSLSGTESGSITISSVPLWLVLFGIGFSVLIGVISGISPANRAVKVSALKAIHNE